MKKNGQVRDKGTVMRMPALFSGDYEHMSRFDQCSISCEKSQHRLLQPVKLPIIMKGERKLSMIKKI